MRPPMKNSFFFYVLLSFVLNANFSARADTMKGVADVKRTTFNWTMNCLGCHEANGRSTGGGTPDLTGSVARFLHLPRGRNYLARVPGVAFANLTDSEVADLLNWMVQTYDSEHIPNDFIPYETEEVHKLRKRPLITDANEERAHLLKQFMQIGRVRSSSDKPQTSSFEEIIKNEY